jgi:FkbM family methyltransferase
MLSDFLSSWTDRVFHLVDVALRRKLRLGQIKWLRSILLKPYRKLINCHGRGVLMNIGGCVPARMPAEYAWRAVEDYEPETISSLKKWMAAAEQPLLVDVGCSVGFVCCAGLFSNLKARVVAIDSDLQSLKAAQQLCSYAPDVGERLSLIWGFVSNEPTVKCDFRQGNEITIEALKKPGITGNPESVHYVCLDLATPDEESFPRHSLDNLIPAESPPGQTILIKCDVEGAELLVLRGAERLLAERHPTLLVSVHPSALPRYGTTKEEVRSFLLARNYEVSVIAVDHEEHWWCEFKTPQTGNATAPGSGRQKC